MKGIEKVVSEIAKTKTKISEYQTRLRELERQKMDMENAEIVSLIRGANIAPEEVQAVIEAFKKRRAGRPRQPDGRKAKMRNKAIFCIMTLLLCAFAFNFATPAYASDGGVETLTVNAAWLDGEMLRIEVTDADCVNSSFAIRLTDYINDVENDEYISIQAVDLNGNQSGVIELKNPYF